jgi:hypothetical protein
MNKLIIIWGAAIIIYLLVTHSSGTTSAFSGITNLVTGSTKALQGR